MLGIEIGKLRGNGRFKRLYVDGFVNKSGGWFHDS